MKKKALSIILFLVPIFLFSQSDTIYLHKVLNNLNRIKSATYFSYKTATAPYDTIASLSFSAYTKEFNNPADTFVGASVACFSLKDTSKMDYFYDGKVKSYLDWGSKTVPVDSFQNNRYPFRAVYPPFFTHVKSLINYALKTKDSITVDLKDLGDSLMFSLSIYNKYIEVVGNRIVNEDPPDLIEGKNSKYDIWINKTNNLPYRLRATFPDKRSGEKIRIININSTNIEVFEAKKYIPFGFKTVFKKNGKLDTKDLVGRVGSDWVLKDIENKEISLSDLKSKILLIQFTGIGCGPCHLSISSLKNLVNEFNRQDFELISIETWNTNIPVIKRYIGNNDIKHKYLLSSGNIKSNYHVSSVPIFFILDEKRVIRKIINGFAIGITEKEMRNTINQLLAKPRL